MPRQEIHTENTKVEQRPINVDKALEQGRDPEIIQAGERVLEDQDWLDELKFNEEPVTIRLEPSADKNAASHHYVAVNGKGCEVWYENMKQWIETPYIPVGQMLIVKRKYVAVLVNAKIDTITTDVDTPSMVEHVGNRERRFTSPVHSFSVIEDRNPAGAAWLSALRRRNM